ncbi:hypothetical protein ANME2D_03306 [Candidatus Methanoperedens nitroreducens]|uniref:Uncharacterized protein n=1 Tax=Candidatus Methanoperedens nitratireducens TaxID=1392998 RepID=A0A062UTM5_9EURY|nr:hypothetical protein ANME2D_03306 [Candidatus Methanoperedens nitroreducens]
MTNAVTMYLPFGLTGSWIGSPPTDRLLLRLWDHSLQAGLSLNLR